jgi:hypothetical protein
MAKLCTEDASTTDGVDIGTTRNDIDFFVNQQMQDASCRIKVPGRNRCTQRLKVSRGGTGRGRLALEINVHLSRNIHEMLSVRVPGPDCGPGICC